MFDGKMLVVLFSLCLPLLSHSIDFKALNDLKFITESYPPYNFEENGFLRGIAVELLLAATSHTTNPIKRNKIKIMPWPRGYHALSAGPGVVLFSTARTEQRENLFKWAGPIAKADIVLIGKTKSGIKIRTFKDVFQYTIGTIRDDVGGQLVTSKGYPEKALFYAADANSLAKQLEFGRIDLWAYPEGVARWFLKRNGFKESDFKTYFTLSELKLYYAFSNDIPDHLVDKFQKNIDRIKEKPGSIGNTLYEDIIFNYL